MPRQQCTTIFKFDELSDAAKERARQWYREGNFDYEWYDSVYEDATECLKLAGFKIDRIFFSGFSSQGDGACFEGTWSAGDAQPVKAMKQHAPKDKTLHAIAATAREIAKSDKTAHVNIKHSGRYYHEYCATVDVECHDEDTAAELEEVARDAMRWIYRQLEKEWEWLNADEQVDDNIRANEYEFTEEGEWA